MFPWVVVTDRGRRFDVAWWFARLGSLVLGWHDRALQRRRLAGLDSRMLRDLGLTPADVRRECAKPFWQL